MPKSNYRIVKVFITQRAKTQSNGIRRERMEEGTMGRWDDGRQSRRDKNYAATGAMAVAPVLYCSGSRGSEAGRGIGGVAWSDLIIIG